MRSVNEREPSGVKIGLLVMKAVVSDPILKSIQTRSLMKNEWK